ncbi:unnamed protein product [Chondrus crispus]|uniref:Phosphoglycerate mutase n=1 Tax=Chondrus crispus TaxID=2769 RepID=R7Q5Q6_CHOCR|nr:unnamed protein product [Chondrus crispus]CDF33349.1 unnamed protein product [Chondrus crispus]|eukprot:XP_005713152.1 unnamed protein product [Chondrus crispus]
MNNPKLYIARHGERLDFVDPKWYESAEKPHDPPLTHTGKEQAKELGIKLSECNITHIFTSPFSRCVNTASNAAASISPHTRIYIEPGMCEWLSADWYQESERGPVWRSVQSLAAEFSNIDADYEPVYPMSHNFDGFPESTKELASRCTKTYRSLLERFQTTGNILLVGHGSSVYSLIEVLVPGAPRKSVPYCCLTECIPTEEKFKYSLGMHCDVSFQTGSQDISKTRYI